MERKATKKAMLQYKEEEKDATFEQEDDDMGFTTIEDVKFKVKGAP